jgi:hypothetical protein
MNKCAHVLLILLPLNTSLQLSYRPYFVKRGQPTKYQFYWRSKTVALFTYDKCFDR